MMIGTKIGPYQVVKVLGEGGMGCVVLAEHGLIRTRHAVKILHDQFSKNDAIVQRFINEARAAGAIGHRNVVEITHVDQLESTGSWYLVMKYFEGRTLTDLLAAQPQLDQWAIVHIIGEALNGLQAAHDHRIIHRDLKPDNLYLTTAKGDPYRTILLDFGVAQLSHDAGVVTQTGALIGTPQYMAPEQHRGAPVDFRTDLWAMGAIAYEMATGHLPYQDAGADRGALTGPEIFHRMMSRPVLDPRYYNPAITPGFSGAILSALALDPAARPVNARALALSLADATPGDGYRPSGYDVLRVHADELLIGDTGLPTQTRAFPSGSRPAPSVAWPGAGPAVMPSASPPVPSPTVQRSGPLDARPVPAHTPNAVPPPGFSNRAGADAASVAAVSTLGAAASQLSTKRFVGPRRLLAAGTGVVVAAAIAIVAVMHGRAPRSAESSVGDQDRVGAAGSAELEIAKPNALVSSVTGSRAAVATPPTATPTPPTATPTPPTATPTPPTATPTPPTDKPPRSQEDLKAEVPNTTSTPPANVGASTLPAQPVVDTPSSQNAAASASRLPAAALATPPAASTTSASRNATSPPATNVPSASSTATTKRPAGTPVPEASNAANAATAPTATGTLKVVILPWAEVWVDGKPLGQTPTSKKLPVGVHRVRLKSDVKEKTLTVTVTASQTTVIDETW